MSGVIPIGASMSDVKASIVPESSDGDFAVGTWQRLAASLRSAEPSFAAAASQARLRLLSSARWPMLRLKRTTLWVVQEVRLTMVATSTGAGDAPPRWTVEVVAYPRFGWLPWVESRVEKIAELTDDELKPGGRLREPLEEALRRISSG